MTTYAKDDDDDDCDDDDDDHCKCLTQFHGFLTNANEKQSFNVRIS